MSSVEDISIRKHTAIHILGLAIQRVFTKARLGSGGITDDGFYYDFEVEESFSEEILPTIEQEMRAIIEQGLTVKHTFRTREESAEFYRSINQPYKLELIEDSKAKRIDFCIIGDSAFVDICRESHYPTTKEVGFVHLVSMAGAYWKGDEHRQMLTRIYGVAFSTEAELQNYIAFREDALNRDHRVQGKKLGLFTLENDGFKASATWLPRGAFARNQLRAYLFTLYENSGYKPIVTTPFVNKNLLDKTGHSTYYESKLMPKYHFEEEEYYLRPMLCPIQLSTVAPLALSYRDLPYRIYEIAPVWRNERESDLQGLFTLREFTQDDGHSVCAKEQVQSECEELIQRAVTTLREFGFTEFEIVLGTGTKTQWYNTNGEWDFALQSLKNAVRKLGFSYKENDYDAAFYGPRLDFIIRDALKRTRALSSIQVDVLNPKQLAITFTGKDGNAHVPYVVHSQISGSMERFFAVLVEQLNGILPLWLQWEQCRILPISSKNEMYAEKIKKQLEELKIRANIDYSQEPVEAKIRQGEEDKVPYMLVVGEKEQSVNAVSVRIAGKGDIGLIDFTVFMDEIVKEVTSKSIKSLFV